MKEPKKYASQYIRMSTDLQRYSTANQMQKIHEYASSHQLTIIKTYLDEGKSGLRLSGRSGLQQLLADVVSGLAEFEIILVYDVSRWGRFQDSDESAHYEFLCRKAGKQVIYCEEIFTNDGSPIANIIKGLKRAMAGEYSRELSEKVFYGQANLARLGWHVGAPSPYGLRRVMVDPSGKFRGQMERGQRKSLQSDKVILAPGPHDEIKVIRMIFNWFISEKIYYETIVKRLSSMKIASPSGTKKWTKLIIKNILSNEKYLGTMIYNRTSERLSSPKKKNPEKNWITKKNAFEPIISQEIFLLARQKIQQNIRVHDDTTLREGLSKVLTTHGRISASLIIATHGVPCPGVYRRRFGTLEAAYSTVGYSPGGEKNEKLRKQFLSNQAINIISKRLCLRLRYGGFFTREISRATILIDEKYYLQVAIISRTKAHPGYRIFFNKLAEIVLAVNNEGGSICSDTELFLIPRTVCSSSTFYINKRRSYTNFSNFLTSLENVAQDICSIINQIEYAKKKFSNE